MKQKWVYAGECGVDAGLIWIGDPCYIMKVEGTADLPWKTWHEFCDTIKLADEKGAQQYDYALGHPGLGVLVKQFGGDGSYPVYVTRNKDGYVSAAVIVFDTTEGLPDPYKEIE